MHVHPSVLSVSLFVNPSVRSSVLPSVRSSVRPSADRPSVRPSFLHPSVRTSVRPSVRPSVCLHYLYLFSVKPSSPHYHRASSETPTYYRRPLSRLRCRRDVLEALMTMFGASLRRRGRTGGRAGGKAGRRVGGELLGDIISAFPVFPRHGLRRKLPSLTRAVCLTRRRRPSPASHVTRVTHASWRRASRDGTHGDCKTRYGLPLPSSPAR